MRLGLLLAVLVSAQPGHTQAVDISSGVVQLKEVLNLARRTNPEIQAARAAWEAAKERVPQARSYPNPMAGIAIVPANREIHTGRGLVSGKYMVEQKIPFPGKLRLAGKVAAAEARAVREKYRGVELAVLAEVTAGYANLFYLERAIETNEEQADLIRHFSRVAERKYAAGRGSQSEAFRAQVEEAKIVNDLITLRSDRGTARARLNALLDRDVDRPLGRPSAPENLTYDLSLRQLLDAAERRRPELAAQLSWIEARKAARARSTLEFFPDLAFGYQHTTIDPVAGMSGADGTDAQAFIVKLSVPLWINRIMARRQEAGRQLAASRAAYRDLRNRTMAMVVELASAVETHLRLANLFKDTVIPLAEAAFSAALKGYEGDRVGFLELLDSQRSLLKFELEYHRHLADFATSRAKLERVIGIPLEEVKKNEKSK